MFDKIKRFLLEVKQEMAKVSWPTREELSGSTIAVIIISMALAIFIFGVDIILRRIFALLY